MTIENNITKEVILRNEIKVDNNPVKGQTATIGQDPKNISFSDWIINMDLYEANKTEVRAKEAEFEDYAFTERTKMVEALSTKEK